MLTVESVINQQQSLNSQGNDFWSTAAFLTRKFEQVHGDGGPERRRTEVFYVASMHGILGESDRHPNSFTGDVQDDLDVEIGHINVPLEHAGRYEFRNIPFCLQMCYDGEDQGWEGQ